jgi:hypothetical protein
MDTPLAIIEALDVDAIRAQIEELDRQAAALRVLLRAALARHRENRRQQREAVDA